MSNKDSEVIIKSVKNKKSEYEKNCLAMKTFEKEKLILMYYYSKKFLFHCDKKHKSTKVGELDF